MTTLTDLTLAQLTAIYSAVSGKAVGPKFFNSRATGVRRVEALLTEKALTLADALRTAGLGNEPAAEPVNRMPPRLQPSPPRRQRMRMNRPPPTTATRLPRPMTTRRSRPPRPKRRPLPPPS